MSRSPLVALAVIGLSALLAVDAAAQNQRIEVQITDLDDVGASVAAFRPGDVVLRDEACVRIDNGSGEYQVHVGAADGGGFTLQRAGTGDRLPFRVVWDSQRGASELRDQPGFMGSFGVSGAACDVSGHRAAFEVRISRSDLLAVSAGSYQGGIVIDLSAP